MGQVIPNFLIVGAGKAGTTSLHEYLAQHPHIFMSPFKEPNYFVRNYGFDRWEDYLGLFAGVRTEKAIGESSTGYLCCEESPRWIKSTLGNVKIIVVLRNPARRAASLYWWMVREGYEDSPTLAEALAREPLRLQSPAYGGHAFYGDYFYFTSGLYSDQVRHYLDTFGEKQVRIYIFEEFIKNPSGVCRDIFEFLGVDSSFEPKIDVHNQARLPALPRLQYWLRTQASDRLLFFSPRLKERLLGPLMVLNTRLGSQPSADLEVEQALMEKYRPDIAKLEQLLGRDFSIWYNVSAG
jgi:hypothetical protein